MSFRITTNGLFRNYRTNLHHNQERMNDSMAHVSSQRLFNSYAEDPAAASEAFQIRRNMWRTDDQIENSEYLISKFSTAFNAMDPIVDGTDESSDLSGIREALRGINGAAGSSRPILGAELKSVASSVVQLMNTKYGDEYVFAGTDGLNAPFAWKDEDDGTRSLLYRGEDVNSLSSSSSYLSEASYVDIGLGMQSDENGIVNPATAYNSALCGADYLGYGRDADGDSKNLAVLMDELGSIFTRCDSDGNYASAADEARAGVLVGKLSDAIDRVQEKHVTLSAQVNYLQTNEEQLKEVKLYMNENLEKTERMDLADAITEMMWAQYSYNAALRIGNSILSQSLIDYLN